MISKKGPIFPTIVSTQKPHDIACDSCGKSLAQHLIAASNVTKIRLCQTCMADLARQFSVAALVNKLFGGGK